MRHTHIGHLGVVDLLLESRSYCQMMASVLNQLFLNDFFGSLIRAWTAEENVMCHTHFGHLRVVDLL